MTHIDPTPAPAFEDVSTWPALLAAWPAAAAIACGAAPALPPTPACRAFARWLAAEGFSNSPAAEDDDGTIDAAVARAGALRGALLAAPAETTEDLAVMIVAATADAGFEADEPMGRLRMTALRFLART